MKITRRQIQKLILQELNSVTRNKRAINEAGIEDYQSDDVQTRLANIENFLRSEFNGEPLEGRAPDASAHIQAFDPQYDRYSQSKEPGDLGDLGGEED